MKYDHTNVWIFHFFLIVFNQAEFRRIKKLSDTAIKVRKMLSHWEERIELSFGYNPCICSCGHKMVFIELCGIKPIAHSPP